MGGGGGGDGGPGPAPSLQSTRLGELTGAMDALCSLCGHGTRWADVRPAL